MATLSERSDNWNARGIIKRDFQHDHSGPEEMPHRSSKKYKAKHKHEFKNGPKHITYENDRYYITEYLESCEACGLNRSRRNWHYKFGGKIWGY